ncbi:MULTISPECIES: hypothetical protein [Saccharopolyspora]|jgi:hypothetical protein|uniref:Uncharacterized protein n=4 Tax=Saccharopolyspora TaxID=1835 RepID=A0A4R4VF74_9PSEU|nr:MULTISPECIES: hypothetical protein [Saccharopolyspora]MBQ0926030.1 hypothetical protein [Saccharopolyspora endophytica]TDC89426.1 hypothetical protein E1161_21485 [Saccharopolyspora aridisoli]TDD03521.1 hypothetical protein E1181_20160 [Saccharopolyspora terrae]TDD92430.1 hypothetical protein E1202_03585 [Saccharopolyspora karakumensis]
MTAMPLETLAHLDVLAQQTQLGTDGIRGWILNNVLPLLLLTVAILLLWLGGGKGDNAGVMRRVGGVLVALAIVGIAVTNAGIDIGTFIAQLFSTNG